MQSCAEFNADSHRCLMPFASLCALLADFTVKYSRRDAEYAEPVSSSGVENIQATKPLDYARGDIGSVAYFSLILQPETRNLKHLPF